MNRRILLFAVMLVATSAVADSTGRYLISMRRPARTTPLGLLRDVGVDPGQRDVRVYANFDLAGATLTTSEAAALRRSGRVRYVDPVVERYAFSDIPAARTDERLATQTTPPGLDAIHARDVWQATRGAGGNLNVVIVDTGIDYDHPDLSARYAGGYNVLTRTDKPLDDHGHGTHVAGTIAAIDNAFGVVGVAPEARLWSVKVLNAQGVGSDESIIASLDWVIAKKREVGGNWLANFSLGAQSASTAERDAFERAIDEGILIVAAAGNTAAEGVSVPAAYPRVLAVSAIDSSSVIAPFSTFGRGIGVAAPGVGVLSTVPRGSIEASDIRTEANDVFAAAPLVGSSRGEVAADVVFCGYGTPEDFTASVAGKIALIRRSPAVANFRFSAKVRNATDRGAVAVLILPDERGDRSWSLYADGETASPGEYPIVLAVINFADATRLIETAGRQEVTVSNRGEDYGYLSGTSMATPHVVGAIALAWSIAPNARPEDVLLAVKATADDLGPKGYDTKYGHGRVNALALAKWLAPGVFGVPPPPPPPKKRRAA